LTTIPKALFLRIHALQPAERLNALSNVNWYQPKGKRALDRLLQNPKEGDFWQADHIVPVAEGGGNCGLENFRTLCTPCHQNETQKLNHRLRLSNVKSTKGSRGEKSMDLRVLFASKGARKSVCRKRKHRPD
jgi:5-methylcytosine-specific restriction endonuclease McrA